VKSRGGERVSKEWEGEEGYEVLHVLGNFEQRWVVLGNRKLSDVT